KGINLIVIFAPILYWFIFLTFWGYESNGPFIQGRTHSASMLIQWSLIILSIICISVIFSLLLCYVTKNIRENREANSLLSGSTYSDRLNKYGYIDIYLKKKTTLLAVSLIIVGTFALYIFFTDPLNFIFTLILLAVVPLLFTINVKKRIRKRIELENKDSGKVNKDLSIPKYDYNKELDRLGRIKNIPVKITDKIKGLYRREQIERDLKTQSMESKQDQMKEYRHQGAAVLMVIFLIVMPLVFAVASLVRIQCPDLQFARIPQTDRIKLASGNYSEPDFYSDLKFYPNLESLDDISFNGGFLLKTEVSTSLGQSVRLHIVLVPDNVTEVDGHIIKSSYNIYSDYINGP
ncbi:MAG: hypothetical protein KAX33_12360, partial [Candidatus Lokiarchaeota archaeon]|nr:hypothetical protein [Candidatus Lokiarchaeota archaeon]